MAMHRQRVEADASGESKIGAVPGDALRGIPRQQVVTPRPVSCHNPSRKLQPGTPLKRRTMQPTLASFFLTKHDETLDWVGTLASAGNSRNSQRSVIPFAAFLVDDRQRLGRGCGSRPFLLARWNPAVPSRRSRHVEVATI